MGFPSDDSCDIHDLCLSDNTQDRPSKRVRYNPRHSHIDDGKCPVDMTSPIDMEIDDAVICPSTSESISPIYTIDTIDNIDNIETTKTVETMETMEIIEPMDTSPEFYDFPMDMDIHEIFPTDERDDPMDTTPDFPMDMHIDEITTDKTDNLRQTDLQCWNRDFSFFSF